MELQASLLGLFPNLFYFFLLVRRSSSQGFYPYCIFIFNEYYFLIKNRS
jgi:hypothetical protein